MQDTHLLQVLKCFNILLLSILFFEMCSIRSALFDLWKLSKSNKHKYWMKVWHASKKVGYGQQQPRGGHQWANCNPVTVTSFGLFSLTKRTSKSSFLLVMQLWLQTADIVTCLRVRLRCFLDQQMRALTVLQMILCGGDLTPCALLCVFTLYYPLFRCGEDSPQARQLLSLTLDRASHTLLLTFPSCLVRVPTSRCHLHSRCMKWVTHIHLFLVVSLSDNYAC